MAGLLAGQHAWLHAARLPISSLFPQWVLGESAPTFSPSAAGLGKARPMSLPLPLMEAPF